MSARVCRAVAVHLAALLGIPTPLLTQQRDSLLRRDTTVLPEIVIAATRGERVRPEDTPVATSRDSVGTPERAAGRVAADLLREVVGAHVQQTSAGQGALVLRGLVGNQVLLLVNGIPLNNGTYRDGPGQYLATIDPEAIDRIEVVRGPASVLYGSDAQGGVVNVITRPHLTALGWSLGAAVHGSSANRGTRARLSAGYGTGAVRISAGATLLQADDLRPGGALGPQRPTGFTGEGFDARVEYAPSATHALTLGVQHFGMRDVPRYDRYVAFRAPAPGPDAQHVFDPQIRQLAYGRYAYRPGTPTLRTLTTTASVTIQREGRLRQRRVSGAPEPRTELTRDDVYTPGLSLVGESWVPVGDRGIALTWGAEGYRDVLASRGEVTDLASGAVTLIERETVTGSIPSGRFPDGATMDRLGIFVAADAWVLPRLHVSAGGRISTFRSTAEVGTSFGGRVEHSASHVTGQAGVLVRLARGLDLTARVAESFRAPNLYDLTNVGPVPGGIVLPNPGAEPERAMSYEAGLRAARTSSALQATVYRTVIDGFIDRAPSSFQDDTLFGGERVYQGLNLGEARVWGFEGEAAHRVGPLDGRATVLYTYGDATLGDGTEEPMTKIPPLSGTGRLRWTVGSRGWIAYHLSWATPQRRLSGRDLADSRIPPGGTPGFAVHGLRGAYSLSAGFTLAAGLENLTDELYRTHASGVDAPGRHVWVGLSVLRGL